MCQKVKESDFHFPTRYLLLLYTLEIVWGSTNYSYKLPARQKKRHWEQQVLMNALCVDGNTIVLYSMQLSNPERKKKQLAYYLNNSSKNGKN